METFLRYFCLDTKAGLQLREPYGSCFRYFFLDKKVTQKIKAAATVRPTIGATNDPQDFSILELVSNGNLGLRLPQMTTEQRDAMVAKPEFQAEKNGKARGLEIFNTDTKCVETWNGSKWIQACLPEVSLPEGPEQILFTINTTDGIYYIPLAGYVGGTYDHVYDWYVSVDGGVAKHIKGGPTNNNEGIKLEDLSNGDHKIRITPFNPPAPGWGNAFGYMATVTAIPCFPDNKNKLISIDAPITTMAFAPEAPEGVTVTNASHMFAYMFYECKNLTTPVKIVDTYKLPPTVTDLSHFLRDTHYDNTNLKSTIDLIQIKDWFDANNNITNLSYFLYGIHDDNTYLTEPIDLTPLQGWFKGNTSITDLDNFLAYTHQNNTNLEDPIDLIQIKDWFDANNNITTVLEFLRETHYDNDALNLKGQIIFPNWIKILNNGNIKNAYNSFYGMFYCNDKKDAGDEGGEPKFEDSSALSSLGAPTYRKWTYYNRKTLPNYGTLGYWNF
ncbi:MAG: hypothetical protein LBS54_00585 [Dysgonamonadaceae bacterium]|jgi:hypothetical protein|nr:hypothetical protein [Dysgonamonadaceae bacterium]